MTIFSKLRIKDATLDAASEIAQSMKWNYEYLIGQKKDIQQEIIDNAGEVTEDIEIRESLIDAKIETYEKVFALLEKM